MINPLEHGGQVTAGFIAHFKGSTMDRHNHRIRLAARFIFYINLENII